MGEKVKIKSLVNGTVGIRSDELRINRTWEKKGAVKPIDLEVLEELIYDPGVEYMFKEGILGIDDLEVKKKLGLEPEDADQPVNIIIFDDAKMDRLMKAMPFFEFKQEVKKAPYEQIRNLVDYSIQKEYTNFEKCEFLKEMTGTDIIKAIQLNRQDKEDLGPVK